MKRCATVFISLIIILTATQILLVQTSNAQDLMDAALYLYGDGTENEFLKTDVPTNPIGLSMEVGPAVGVFIMWIIGTFETVPFQKDVTIQGTVMFHMWVEQMVTSPGLVQFKCDVLVDGEETGYEIESERILVTDVHEITFGGYVNLHVNAGSILGMYIGVLYSGVELNVYWESAPYPSQVIVPGDWGSVLAQNPVMDEEEQTASISGGVIHALGTEEITGYELDIEGYSPANTVLGPEVTILGNMITVSWIWDWGEDEAEEGSYSITIIGIDKSGNTWSDVTSLQIIKIEPPPPPPIYNWTTIDRITSHPGAEYYSSIIQDSDGTYWITYSQYEGYYNEDIYIKKSQDGIHWGLAKEVWGNYSYEYQPSMIQDNNGTYLTAWTSNWGGRNQIWISKSTDGDIWDEPILAIKTYYDNYHPSLMQDSQGRYWIAWSNFNRSNYQRNIYLTYSYDGITWDEQPIKITADYDYDEWPSLIQDSGGTFRLAFASDRSGNYDIWLTSSDSPCTSWSSPIQLTTEYSSDSHPSLILNVDGGFNISWESRRTGRYEIWFTGSPDWNLWYHPEQVTETEYPDSYKFYPSLTQDKNETLWVTWYAYSSGSYNIWLSNKETNVPPTVSIINPVGEQSGDITITYYLKDTGSDKCGITPLYSLDGITFIEAPCGEGEDGVTGLSSSPQGTTHTFVWDSETGLSGYDISTVYFRIIPCDCQMGISCTTPAFHVDNNEKPEMLLEPISDVQTGSINISYMVSDPESDILSIIPEYSKDGKTYYEATKGIGGDGTKNLKSSQNGESYMFVWDSKADFDDVEEENIYFRITPKDNDKGTPDTIFEIQLDNKAPSILSGPDVISKTYDTVTISWETDEPSDTILYYGFDTNYGNLVIGSSDTKIHTITLESLSPETTYHYYMSSTDQYGNGPSKSDDYYFTTEQIPNDPPVIIITTPKEGDEVSAKITISGEAMDPDDDTIQFVEVKADEGEWVAVEGTETWSYELNTKDLTNGKHYLHARANDGRNYSEVFSISIEVNNKEESSSIWLFLVIGAVCSCIIAIVLALIWRRSREQEMRSRGLSTIAQPADFIPYVEAPTVTPLSVEIVEPMVEEARYTTGGASQPFKFEDRTM